MCTTYHITFIGPDSLVSMIVIVVTWQLKTNMINQLLLGKWPKYGGCIITPCTDHTQDRQPTWNLKKEGRQASVSSSSTSVFGSSWTSDSRDLLNHQTSHCGRRIILEVTHLESNCYYIGSQMN